MTPLLATGHSEQDSRYYDDIYRRGYNTSGYFPLYNQVLKIIATLPDPSILEIGCGVGDLGKLLIDKGYPYRGFDFSPEAIACSRKLSPSGDFRTGDAYDAQNYRPQDYNIAVALEVLEHLDDLRIIKNIPAGVDLIASVPNFNDTAHLRIYKNPQDDIIARFSPYLQIKDILAFLSDSTQPDDRRTIYLFHALRLPDQSAQKKSENIGRNAPCPCGSGRKFKHCCLRLVQ